MVALQGCTDGRMQGCCDAGTALVAGMQECSDGGAAVRQ